MKLIIIVYFVLISSFFLAITLNAQQGTLRGSVIDGETGDPILFGDVLVKELGTGTNTDIDGKFNLTLPVGMYTLVFSYLGYSDFTVSELAISADKVEVLNISLMESAFDLDEVVVKAKQFRNTAAAINSLKKKSPNLLDGVSAQTFSKTGDGDAASAIKRVTGVSVEGGKYVYIRGLGDRYTKTILNGMEIPGLDPDRNTVQMDIFPTNLIDNIVVYKTFTPDVPGDFTGGLVNIETKDFPERKTTSIGVSASLNPDMHYRNDFLTYQGGQTDWLGFDDGTRSLPFSSRIDIPNPAERNSFLTPLTQSFEPILAAEPSSNLMNYGLSISHGNQINQEKVTWGYNMALNYNKTQEHYHDAQFNEFLKNPLDLNDTDLFIQQTRVGDLSKDIVLWSALLGGSMKYKASKFSLKVLRTQNGEAQASQQFQEDYDENPATIYKNALEYSQRAVTNIILSGKHQIEQSKLAIEWKLSPTFSSISEPDSRLTTLQFFEGQYLFSSAVGAISTRRFRSLKEDNYTGRLDIEKKWNLANGSETSVKLGIYGGYKSRDYSILTYENALRNASAFSLSGDPNQLLSPDLIWTVGKDAGVYIRGNEEPSNTYGANQMTMSGYLMNELNIAPKLKATYGVRVEKPEIRFTGQNAQGTLIYDNESVLDEVDILPSFNIVYALTDDMNIRGAASRTVARPTFKEKSTVQIFDGISGRTFLGNLDLEQTDVINLDLRWEKFFNGGQLISVSGFMKDFNRPIEIVSYSEAAPDQFTPRNVESAQVLGIEVEMKKSLDFVSSALDRFSLTSNVTVVDAKTKMSEDEFTSRQRTARPGEVVSSERDMVGQSPFIVNLGLGFSSHDNLWEANIIYNVQGKRLNVAGIGVVPDVYEQSFHSLNVRTSRKMGAEGKWRVSLSAENILSQRKQWNYEAFSADSQIYQLYTPGRVFSLGVNWSI